MYLREALKSIFHAYPEATTSGVESPPFHESYSEGLYGLFLYVNEAAFSLRRDVVYFDPSTVKSLAKMDPSIRRGRMDKTDMIDAAKADTEVKKWNHNEADAYIVARTAARFWDFLEGALTEEELTPAEHHTFLHKHIISKGPRKGQIDIRGLAHRENERFFRFSRFSPEDIAIEEYKIDRNLKEPVCPPPRRRPSQ